MEVTRHPNHRGLVLGMLSLVVAACSGGGSDPKSATLSVSLMDAPIDDVTAVNVEITAIWLKGPNGPAQQLTLTQSPLKVNLLSLTEGEAAVLIDAQPIEPGTYEWLAMDVSADFDLVYDSYVDTSTGGQEEIHVPSGRVRLVGGFEIGANQAVQMLFDWDLRKGLVDPPGQPGFLLNPAFRILDVAELAVLRGSVALSTLDAAENACRDDDADLDVGNSVYVFAGDVMADDIDAADAEPITTVDVVPNGTEYAYRTVIAPGTYTIALTCQAGNDDPADGANDDLEFVATDTRTVVADEEVVINF
jgi:hypothetical protein